VAHALSDKIQIIDVG